MVYHGVGLLTGNSNNYERNIPLRITEYQPNVHLSANADKLSFDQFLSDVWPAGSGLTGSWLYRPKLPTQIISYPNPSCCCPKSLLHWGSKQRLISLYELKAMHLKHIIEPEYLQIIKIIIIHRTQECSWCSSGKFSFI